LCDEATLGFAFRSRRAATALIVGGRAGDAVLLEYKQSFLYKVNMPRPFQPFRISGQAEAPVGTRTMGKTVVEKPAGEIVAVSFTNASDL
jgi:hypothetical protein